MKYIDGDLLEGDWDSACHVCNLYKTMGSGVAYFLKKKWPEVYMADCELDVSDEVKLGTFSKAFLPDSRTVYNLYAMWGLGNNGTPLGRNCTYDNLYNALYTMCDDITHSNKFQSKFTIGLPYLMGACRAGGSWRIIEAIIQDIEETFDNIEFVCYVLPEFETSAKSTKPNENQNI